jgi:hypothetical protein
MSSSDALTPAQIETWLGQVDVEIAAVQAKIEPLVAEQARLHDRQTLLKSLLASFGDDATASVPSPPPLRSEESTRERVHRQAVEILTQVGGALHTNDLHAEFVKRGHEIPGAGKPNNITVHLGGWPDIVSPERGVYGLVEHVGPQPPKPTPTRKRKRRTRS